ncbi:MAG: amino acid synthesis family protein, partial [Pseudomonadota bacterium]
PVVRKMLTQIEEVRTDGGPPLETPLLRGAILAVAENPFAGRYEPDIAPWMEALRPLGLEMAGALIAALGGDPGRVEGYGKGAIVGAAGELEHGALWHAPGGYAMRELLGGADGRARAIVPSTKKLGGVGCRLDVPITHVTASYVRSHFDSVEVGAPDGPGPNEIVFALAMTTGPRPHARVGGLAAADVKGEDGLR